MNTADHILALVKNDKLSGENAFIDFGYIDQIFSFIGFEGWSPVLIPPVQPIREINKSIEHYTILDFVDGIGHLMCFVIRESFYPGIVSCSSKRIKLQILYRLLSSA